MEVLERRENPNKYCLIAGGVGGVMIVNLQRLNFPYPLAWVSLLVGSCVFLWFRYGNKPAAWVKDGHLFIFNGLFAPHKLNINEVENINYEISGTSEHVIIARLKNGSSQSILIHNRKEHIDGNRLEKFINQHFLPYENKTSNK